MRAAAIAVVLLMLAVVTVPMVSNTGDAEGQVSETHTVVYHPSVDNKLLNSNGDPKDITIDGNHNYGSASDVEVVYTGSIVSTEYNPQVWKGSFNPSSGTGDNWYGIVNYEKGKTLVFTGWVYAEFDKGELTGYSDMRYPGEVMSETEMAKATGTDGKIHIYATWDTLVNYSRSLKDTETWGDTGDEFRNIVLLSTNDAYNKAPAAPVTIRGVDSNSAWQVCSSDGYLCLAYNLIVDSIGLSKTAKYVSNHGDGRNGLYADGHVLVIGTGVTPMYHDNSGNHEATSTEHLIQVFGGSQWTIDDSGDPTRLRDPYDGDGEARSEKFKTMLIVHSGDYMNVVGGSVAGNISGSVYTVVKDAAVYDTLAGGCSKGGDISGSVYLYATSLNMFGDTYEEEQLRKEGSNNTVPEFTLLESTIITGGSNDSGITGDTHIFISGDSEIWDVQAGGRRGQSTVAGQAGLEISGDAWVKHVACGSITDGIQNDAVGHRSSVTDTYISVKDRARVASVFGAGYDTFYSAKYVSMMGNASDIRIEISGGTVGYVYGGGYRGTIGTSAEPINSISISITGGTILGDVYGGGRGGIDKVLHDQYGNLLERDGYTGSSSAKDSTGVSKVYVNNVTISVNDCTIHGSIFGGGQSVAVMDRYDAGPAKNAKDVASMVVKGTLTVDVNDCTIHGSIYGAGRGVEYDRHGNVITEEADKPRIIAMGHDGSLKFLPWFNWDSEPAFKKARAGSGDGYDYTGFAEVEAGDISIDIDGFESGELTADRAENIYGGGMFGKLSTGTIGIHIDASTIADCVFGGGRGSDADTVAGRVEAKEITIAVGKVTASTVGSENLPYAIFGGGENAFTELGDGSAEIYLGPGSVIRGDVHGGGMGRDDSGADGLMIMHGDRTVVLDGATVHGNIYGGSRFGGDGEENPTIRYPDTESVIKLVSGSVTVAVYGGGFQGNAYMHSKILVGSVNGYGNGKTLTLGSVLGGGNLDPHSFTGDLGSVFNTELLHGDSDIQIGSEGYASFAITGLIVGSGNSSDVAGHREVRIDGLKDGVSSPVASIQRVDSLHIADSTFTVSGAQDAASNDVSRHLSLNRIGEMRLDGGVLLTLQSETESVGRYVSTINDTPTTGGVVEGGNTIRLEGGVLLDILGKNGEPGHVDGYTVLARPDGDRYYGAFARSNSYAPGSGFMVHNGSIYVDANLLSETDSEPALHTWYISGFMSVSEQLNFSAAGNWSDKVSVTIPRLDKDSHYVYLGAYTEAAVQNGLFVVGSGDYVSFNKTVNDGNAAKEVSNRMFFDMSLTSGGTTTQVASHDWEGDGFQRIYSAPLVDIGDVHTIGIGSSLLSSDHYTRGYGTAGAVGKTVIHIAEMYKGLYIQMIDITVSMYVDAVVGNPVDIFVTLMVNGSVGTFKGRGYVNLPLHAFGPEYYRFVSLDNNAGMSKLSMWSDTGYLGLNGWNIIEYSQEPGFDVLKGKNGDSLGRGSGTRVATLAFDYEGLVRDFTLYLAGSTVEGGVETTNYHVHVHVQESVPVKVIPAYQSAEGTLYLSVVPKEEDGGYGPPWKLEWIADLNDVNPITVPYGTSLSVITAQFVVGSGTETKTLEEAIEDMLPDEQRETLFGWFVDKSLLSRFNMGSNLSEDLILYAGCKYTVTFYANGAPVNISQIRVDSGKSLHGMGIYNVSEDPGENGIQAYSGGPEGRPGFHLSEVCKVEGEEGRYSWVTYDGKEYKTFDFGGEILHNYDLYLFWDEDEYDITVTVGGLDSGEPVLKVNGTVKNGWINGALSFKANYGDRIELTVPENHSIITHTFNPKGWAASVELAERGMSFLVDDRENGSDLTLEVEAQFGHLTTIVVDLTHNGSSLKVTNYAFTMTVKDSGGKPLFVFEESWDGTKLTVSFHAPKDDVEITGEIAGFDAVNATGKTGVPNEFVFKIQVFTVEYHGLDDATATSYWSVLSEGERPHSTITTAVGRYDGSSADQQLWKTDTGDGWEFVRTLTYERLSACENKTLVLHAVEPVTGSGAISSDAILILVQSDRVNETHDLPDGVTLDADGTVSATIPGESGKVSFSFENGTVTISGFPEGKYVGTMVLDAQGVVIILVLTPGTTGSNGPTLGGAA